MKRTLTLLALILLLPSFAFATPSSVDRVTDHIQPLIQTDYIKGDHFVATSTATSTLQQTSIIGAISILGEYFTNFTNYVRSLFSAGTGISLTGGQITNTGVTSIVAGTNVTISGATGAVTINSTASGSGSGTVSTSTVPTVGQLSYWTSNGYPSLLGSVATSTPSIGTILTYSGTLGNLVGGTSGTFGIANSAITNAMLANSSLTVNGTAISLGGSGTITAASSTLLANSNTFTGVNNFTNASGDWSGTWQTHQPSYFQVAGNYATFGYPFPSNATSTNINFSGGITGALTGNADTATKLFTPRAINGVNFDGSAPITITAASSTLLADTNTFSGALNTFGNATTTQLTVSNSSYFDPTGAGFVNIGNAGTEGPSIQVGGATYTSEAKISDIGNTDTALLVLHKHSTTLSGVLGFARSNDNTVGHTALTNNQDIGLISFVGSAGTDYKPFAFIRSGSDTTGTISNTSSPGRISFDVSPDGSIVPVTAMTIKNSGNVGIGTTTPYSLLSIGGNVVVGASTAGGTLGDLYLPKLGTAVGTFLAADGTGKLIATSTSQFLSTIAGTTGQLPYFSATNTLTATSSIFLAASGSLGIGTSTPDDMVEIRSNSSSKASFAVYNNAGTNTLKIADSGVVTANDVANSWTGRLSPTHVFSVGLATSTTWTATTTSPRDFNARINSFPWTGTIQNAVCSTDTSYLNVALTSGGTSLGFIVGVNGTPATTTLNASITKGSPFQFDAGTTTTSGASAVQCTITGVETP